MADRMGKGGLEQGPESPRETAKHESRGAECGADSAKSDLQFIGDSWASLSEAARRLVLDTVRMALNAGEDRS